MWGLGDRKILFELRRSARRCDLCRVRRATDAGRQILPSVRISSRCRRPRTAAQQQLCPSLEHRGDLAACGYRLYGGAAIQQWPRGDPFVIA